MTMVMMFVFTTSLIMLIFMVAPAHAFTEGICNLGEFKCGRAKTSRSANANPSSTSRININPSAVPTEKGLGVEFIGYKNLYDAGLVRGLGRVGAAISPSNSEDTFFGAPAYETDSEYLLRKEERRKYRGQKVTLATAFNLFEVKKSNLRRASLNLGVLAKYNQSTYATTPGAGLNGILGPFSYGYSVYRDETLISESTLPDGGLYREKLQSIVESYSVGIYLNSLILDYSSLRMQNTGVEHVNLSTATLLLDRFIISFSERRETSRRSHYNFQTKVLDVENPKVEQFYGVQMKETGNFSLGVMYNYYLLRELSGTLTLLF